MLLFTLASIPILLWGCYCYRVACATSTPAFRRLTRLSVSILGIVDLACWGIIALNFAS